MYKKISCITLIIIITFMFNFIWANSTLLKLTFETDNEGWNVWSNNGKDLTTYTMEKYTEGKRSLLCNDSSTSFATGLRSPFISIEPGKDYTALCDMFLVSGNVKCYLRFYDADGKQIFSENSGSTEGKWETIKIAGTAPKNAVKANVVVATTSVTTGVAYVDNIKLVLGNSLEKTPEGNNQNDSQNSEEKEKEKNIIASQSFENGLEPWATWRNVEGKIISVTSKVSDGKKAYYINDSANDIGPGIQSDKISISQGNTYVYKLDGYCESGTIKMYIRFFSKDGEILNSESVKIPKGSWNTISHTVVAPIGAIKTQVIVCGDNKTLGKAYVDNFRLIKSESEPKVNVDDVEFIPPKQVSPVKASLVQIEKNKLIYNSYNNKSDKISDYTYAGFYAGEYNLPESRNIPVVITLSPSNKKDDTARIQNAIDKVYEESIDNSLKMIKLKAGTYKINKNGLTMKSGIILSGEGQGPTGTILYAKDAAQHTVIKISGNEPKKNRR